MTDDIISRLREDPSDQELWSLWYEKMYPRIIYSSFQSSTAEAYSARDAVHDALVKFVDRFIEDKLFEKLRKIIRSDDDAVFYLKNSVRDALLNEHRRETRRRVLLKTYPTDVPHGEDSTRNQTQAQALENIEEVRNALKLFDEVEKKIFLATLNGDSLEEISKQVGKSYSNVGVIRHRMEKKLLSNAKMK